MPLTRSEAARALREVIDRFTAERLAGDPRLCRNALRDRLPDDPGTVSVLCSALEVDVVTRLTAKGVDPSLVVKQTATALARQRSVDQRTATWAISTWAEALGVVDPTAEETLVVDRPLPAAESAAADESAETVRRQPTRAPVTDPIATARIATAGPAEERPARRRVRWWMIAAAAVVLIAVIVGGVIALSPHTTAVRFTAATTGGATGTVEAGSKTRDLTGTRTTLAVGDRITASHGPLTIRLGSRTVVRLDTGTTAQVAKGTGGADATLRLTTGRLYVNAAGDEAAIDSTAGVARVDNARLVASCTSGSCTYQALQDTVKLSGSSVAGLRPHESVARGASDAAKTAYATPDALRADTWVTSNTALDKKASLTTHAVTGPSAVGSWRIGYAPKGNALGVVYRQVTIADRCTATSGCSVTAASTYSTCPSQQGQGHVFSCAMHGTVTAADETGIRLTIDWGSNPVDCTDSSTHAVDGHASYRDTLALVTSSGSTTAKGQRVAHFAPQGSAGAVCTDAGKALTDPTIPFSGKKGSVVHTTASNGIDLTQASEDMVDHHVGPGVQCKAVAPPKGAQAQKNCAFTGAKDPSGTTRPKSFSMIQYILSSPARAAAYQQLSAPAGRRSSGNCSTGPCEQPFVAPDIGSGARVATWTSGGTAHLVAYAPSRTGTVVVATGSTPQALYRWLADRQDFSLHAIPFFGL